MRERHLTPRFTERLGALVRDIRTLERRYEREGFTRFVLGPDAEIGTDETTWERARRYGRPDVRPGRGS